MMIASIMLLVITTSILMFIVSMLRGRNKNKEPWKGRMRHVIVLIISLCAFALLYGLFLILDLFEGNHFSWSAMQKIIQVSAVIFAVGISLLAVSLVVTRK